MPSHPDRVRTAALPAGYQFGDAADRRDQPAVAVAASCARNTARPWRRPSDTAAEQLARRGDWNVIEGESFASDEERHHPIEGVES